ncbi:MAG: thiamine biosynthesis protein ThiJ [Gammaproteobacteria bacterium RIFCSPHIGHO2_12_FULL_63_22]|nr:MAG: thiamine biosynthesis protein ThiJ [Gammaproteobacteria bacterium RIFCSPHIGHO2_12_FULL_63_22]
MARILIPLPDTDFDTTEVAVPWRVLTDAGHAVVFATETGRVATCDPLLLTGVVFGKLGADLSAIDCYRQVSQSSEFKQPRAWPELVATDFDALLLPGGHAQGMRQYLDSALLQSFVAEFALLDRPIAAICHGVLLMARAKQPGSDRSVLHGRRTTCLPRYMEALAFGLSFWKLGRYYRTYPAYVESEVRAALASPSQFERGPITLGDRGTQDDDSAAFVLEDGNYISARWPGDAWLFARKLVAQLKAQRMKAAA